MPNAPVDVFKFYDMSAGADACWAWSGPYGGRRSELRPYFQASGVRKIAYRWVWELVNGEVPAGQMIRHKCDNGSHPIGCGNPRHMELGTHEDNMQDMTSRGRHGLPKTAVRAIRKLLSQGVTQQEVGDRFGVSRETISAVATGRVYSHVDRRAPDANVSSDPNPVQPEDTKSGPQNGSDPFDPDV